MHFFCFCVLCANRLLDTNSALSRRTGQNSGFWFLVSILYSCCFVNKMAQNIPGQFFGFIPYTTTFYAQAIMSCKQGPIGLGVSTKLRLARCMLKDQAAAMQARTGFRSPTKLGLTPAHKTTHDIQLFRCMCFCRPPKQLLTWIGFPWSRRLRSQ
jgi:hypothetical protein